MASLGKRVWDDDGFAIATILPKFGNINLGSTQHPFEKIYVNELHSLTDTIVTDDLTVTDDAAVGGDLSVVGNAVFSGNLTLDTLGKGLSLKEGANARAGLATLVGGTVTVATTAVAAGDRILFARQTTGGTLGHLSAPTASIVAGTSFVINSSDVADTSTVYWTIVRPA